MGIKIASWPPKSKISVQNWQNKLFIDFITSNYISFPDTIIPACNFHDMLAIYTASKIRRRQFHLHRNPKWRPRLNILTVYNVVCISLFLSYKFDIFVKMYDARMRIWIYESWKCNEFMKIQDVCSNLAESIHDLFIINSFVFSNNSQM